MIYCMSRYVYGQSFFKIGQERTEEGRQSLGRGHGQADDMKPRAHMSIEVERVIRCDLIDWLLIRARIRTRGYGAI